MKQALHDKIGALLHLDANRSYKVLDLGCGRGELLAHLSTSMNPRSALVGIDESEDAIRTARNNYRSIEFLQQKLVDTLGFDDDSVDIVISVDVLECIPDRSALIDEVFRILKPGGTVLFAHWDWDTQVYNSEHKAIIRTFVAAFS
ncbi:MAG: methyltransferase domain-containing protein, partial [Gammaproteobacteria bacterium]|nr:methyltransferase domain-containing protein [Gammaproteobacteria bacterium]